MIKAVIFDWGGVLIDNPVPGIIAYCAKTLGTSDAEFRKALQKFEAPFVKGDISEDVFWERICPELNVQKPTVRSLWGEAFRKLYSPRKEVFSLVSSLRKNGYRTGFLSNCEASAMEYFYEQGYDMFDTLVFSCAEGTMKPEKRIYELILERIALQPKDVVFIDDRGEYINGAKEVGINTILFRDINQIKKELASFSVRIE
jgi:epoxide hydrolase-like predicted phosphatase